MRSNLYPALARIVCFDKWAGPCDELATMFHQKLLRFLAVLSCFAVAISARAQFTISGVADKTTYNNTVTLTIGTQAGYNYNATLNWKPITSGVAVVVNKPDFYELRVDATNTTTSAVTSQYLRFIVNSSERVDTEWGLPPHVPFPVIQSCSNEFAGAHLRMLVPSAWPGGLPLPVVAWVMDEQEHPVRANGILRDNGGYYGFYPPAIAIQIKRGVGSGFIPTTTNADSLNVRLRVSSLTTNPPIVKESNVVWTSAAGVLGGDTAWPVNSRIQITAGLTVPNGMTLTVGEGSIVRINPGIDITNFGTVTINGTTQNPVVFMPATTGQPWGGFLMRTSTGVVNATATIFTGSGANQTWFGSGGNVSSHRKEQALFYCDGGQTLNLVDCAAMYLSGQLAHSRNASITTTVNATRFLMQRTTSGGEFTGSRFTVNDSAFIECPDDSVNFVDGDNDALYFVSGSHFFTNTLVGWTKDDGIDSGGSGYGPLTYQSCWFEATFHEGNSLSGFKNVHTHGTVYFDCGQGIEGGYDSPTGRVENCFFSMNQSGIRQGDNYATFSEYTGPMTATNNISIYNHRDLFGFNWDNSNNGGWTNNYRYFFASNNLVSVLDTNYPNNTLWNPATDGWRLGALGGVGRVGVGFGARGSTLGSFADGIPVGLSRFCTNEVLVNYSIDGTDGTHNSGTLVFPQGLTRRFIPVPISITGVLRVALSDPLNADVTGTSSLLFQNIPAAPGSAPTVLSALGATWKYLDDGSEQGIPWRGTNFNDSAWGSGAARLGFGSDQAPLGTTIRRFVTGTSGPQVTNFYFRRAIVVTNPAAFTSTQFRYQRDDGCIVYLNGDEVFRNNMPAGTIVATNFATATVSGVPAAFTFYTNNVASTNFLAGTNFIAVEVHQSTFNSSDIGWELEVNGLPASSPPRVNLSLLGTGAVIYWGDPSFTLEQSPEANQGAWSPAGTISPVSLTPTEPQRIYRLKR